MQYSRYPFAAWSGIWRGRDVGQVDALVCPTGASSEIPVFDRRFVLQRTKANSQNRFPVAHANQQDFNLPSVIKEDRTTLKLLWSRGVSFTLVPTHTSSFRARRLDAIWHRSAHSTASSLKSVCDRRRIHLRELRQFSNSQRFVKPPARRQTANCVRLICNSPKFTSRRMGDSIRAYHEKRSKIFRDRLF